VTSPIVAVSSAPSPDPRFLALGAGRYQVHGSEGPLRSETVVPADPRAAALARSVLDNEMSSALLPRIADSKVVLSEVVANAVQHGTVNGRGNIRLVVDLDSERLHVRVEQELSAVSVRPSYSPLPHPGGFGLRIVEALADDWGAEPGPPGCVWFQIEA